MNNSFNKLALGVMLVIGIVASFVLISKNMITYAIITGTISVVLALLLLSNLFHNRTPEDTYNKYLKDILKTFDAVLINSDNIPSTDGRSIIKVKDFEDLIDAQVEIRKPICYQRDARSSLFVLLDDKQAFYYILKVDDKEESPFDKWLKDEEKAKLDFDKSLLKDIENTTIIKIDNNKSYKVSPIREEAKKEIKNVRKVTKAIESMPKLRDTVELSKTQLFKDLNKRIQIAENNKA